MINAIDIPLLKKNEFKGIINWNNIEPITQNYAVPSSINDYAGTSETLVYWNETLFLS